MLVILPLYFLLKTKFASLIFVKSFATKSESVKFGFTVICLWAGTSGTRRNQNNLVFALK